MPAVVSDLAFKALNVMHRGALKASGGRVGWRARGMPMLELTTVGRKSGQPRSVMLPAPVQDDGAWVIVASRGGADHHPAWFLNLRTIRMSTSDCKVGRSGRCALESRQPKNGRGSRPPVTAVYLGYARYQEKTDREIPLVLLEPEANGEA